MSHKRILSMAPGQEELWDKAEQQGYVWIKTEDGFITKDEIKPYMRISTFLFGICLNQENYGKTWAFTKEELKNDR